MKYIGNYKDFISDDWITYLSEHEGQPRPQNIPSDRINTYDGYSKGIVAGYDLSKAYWHIFEKYDVPFDIEPPWTTGKIHWWITKMMPGDIMPMHEDPPTLEFNCIRYWIPLQDYNPGHVFIIQDELITDYKAGDVYKFDLSKDIHGAANIGYTPRFVLQVTEFI